MPRQGPQAQRFCLWHAPQDTPPKTLIVHVHAFAEEMNKSRRMAALQSYALARAGHAVMQIDLLGCGDSAGDFGDATWQSWVDDVVDAVGLARDRHARIWPGAPRPQLWLWGHRAGCLIAAAAMPRIKGGCNFLFWQPTHSGKAVLQQFLRLETAGALLGKSTTRANNSARAALAAGDVAQIAGYRLNAELAGGLEAARLRPGSPIPADAGRVEWIDLAPVPQPEPTPATQQGLREWATAGFAVRHHSVTGPAFWQTTEIEDAPALIVAALEALAAAAARDEAPTVAVPLAA